MLNKYRFKPVATVIVGFCLLFLPFGLNVRSLLGYLPPDAKDPTRRIVEEWLDDQPRQVKGQPPNDNIEKLRSKWLSRGKKIPTVNDALIAIVRDKDSSRRRSAALVIGEIVGADALGVLQELFDSDDPRLQLNALVSLRAIDNPKRIPVLAAALKSTFRQPRTKDEGVPTNAAIVRGNIAILLSEIKEKAAIDLLDNLKTKEEDPYVLGILKDLNKRDEVQ